MPPVPLDPLKEWKCTYANCFKSFDTEKQMKHHKLDEPLHFYCKKCDVDCEDRVGLTEHKVEAMAPWLEQKGRRPEGAPKHIVCEFCGMDFKSMGGRELHRTREHQAQQSIQCPGCGDVFVRAGHLIGHLEKDECSEIRAYEFLASIQHKYIRKEIMEQPEVLVENLQINPAYAAPPDKPGLIDDESAEVGEAEPDGGVAVPLLDRENEEQKGGEQPLQAKLAAVDLDCKKAESTKAPLTRSNLETWPSLAGKRAFIADYVKKQKVGSSPSTIETTLSASQPTSQMTSRRGGLKVYTESYPTLQDSTKSPDSGQPKHAYFEDEGDDDDNASVATAKAEDVLGRPAAWTTENTSRALFGDIKQAPAPAYIKSILKKRDEETQPKGILDSRWWDPDSTDYIPDRFYHAVIRKFCCPFASCENLPLDSAYELEVHFKDAHTMRRFRCPSCRDIFKSAQGLVSHIESTQKCPIKKSKNFKQVLDEVTGGFLKAKHMPKPAIYRANQDLVKSGKVVDGVMSTMYKAKMPHEKELQF